MAGAACAKYVLSDCDDHDSRDACWSRQGCEAENWPCRPGGNSLLDYELLARVSGTACAKYVGDSVEVTSLLALAGEARLRPEKWPYSLMGCVVYARVAGAECANCVLGLGAGRD